MSHFVWEREEASLLLSSFPFSSSIQLSRSFLFFDVLLSAATFDLYFAILLPLFLQSCIGYFSFKPRVYSEQPLYLTKVVVRSAFILPSPDHLICCCCYANKGNSCSFLLQAARMRFIYENEPYCLNLIDTPGHVDFSYEVCGRNGFDRKVLC